MPYSFTSFGMEFYLQKLEYLRAELRVVGQSLGDAAGISRDWHDNFEYEDARRRVEMLGKRVAEAEEVLKEASVVEPDTTGVQAAIGSTVECYVGEDLKEYTIGGFGETFPSEGLISYLSPVGSALLGTKPGDELELSFGGKVVDCEIAAVKSRTARYDNIIEKLKKCLKTKS